MMEEIVTLKRKWSSVEDDPTRPLSDHEEEEAKEYRNENIDDFNMNFADTPGPPSVEIVDRPKRIKKPSSNVLSPYIVFKKKPRKTNDVFDVKKVKEFYATLKRFEKEFIDCPKQFNTDGVGDCGPWVCIFLERLVKNQLVKKPGEEDTKHEAAMFRMRFAKICYHHILPEVDDKVNEGGKADEGGKVDEVAGKVDGVGGKVDSDGGKTVFRDSGKEDGDGL